MNPKEDIDVTEKRDPAGDLVAIDSGRTGGRGGIRTHGEFYPTFDFESSALNRTQPPFLDAI